jgi:hypothetical protein
VLGTEADRVDSLLLILSGGGSHASPHQPANYGNTTTPRLPQAKPPDGLAGLKSFAASLPLPSQLNRRPVPSPHPLRAGLLKREPLAFTMLAKLLQQTLTLYLSKLSTQNLSRHWSKQKGVTALEIVHAFSAQDSPPSARWRQFLPIVSNLATTRLVRSIPARHTSAQRRHPDANSTLSCFRATT